MSEDTTPTEIHTLDELREKFGANSVEYYRKYAQELEEQLGTAKELARRFENYFDNKVTAINNFETGMRELLEEDSERVTWQELVRPLKYLGIELEQEWQACVSISVDVTVKAMTRDEAEAKLNDFRTWEVEINNGDFDTWSVEETDWSDLEEKNN